VNLSERTRKWDRFLGFSILLAVLIAPVLAGEARAQILSGCEIDYPPFCVVDEAGRAGGFSVELLRAALAAMNREVTFRTGTWPEVRGWLEAGEVAVLPLVGRTPERDSLFDFTFPYMTMHGAIVVRKEVTDIRDLDDLRGRHVAVMQGDNAEEFLRREDRGIEIHTTATFSQALQELSAGMHDAVVIQRLVALRLISQGGPGNLKIINRPVEGFSQDFCFAVKEGDSETLAMLNEGLSLVMAGGTYNHLHAQWFAALELPPGRIVVGGDHAYPPFEFLDERGRPSGYNVELTRAIAQEMELDIEIRLGPWSEIVDGLENGEIDIVQGMFYLPERDLKFDFSPYHALNHYIGATRKGEDDPPISLEDLAGKRIVVQRGDAIHDYLISKGLSDQLTLMDSQEEVLRSLAKGDFDCAVVVRITALELLSQHDWTNLQLGRRPLLSMEYCYAVPNGHAALLAQFSEGLAVLKERGDYRRIHDRWLGVYQIGPPPLLVALRYSAMVLVPLLVVLATILLWSWFLKRQVSARTRELQESEALQRAIITCSPVALYSYDFEGKVLTWNPSAEMVYGWRAEEVLGRFLPNVPADKLDEFAAVRNQVRNGKAFAGRELVRQKKGGALFPVRIYVAPIIDERGNRTGIMSAAEDITSERQTLEALRESEARFRLFADTAPVGVIIADLDERTLYASGMFVSMFGYTIEEIPTLEAWLARAHPDEALRNRVRSEWKTIEQVMLQPGAGIKPMVHPVTCKDGAVRQIEFRVSASGDLCFVVFTDVTEHGILEQQLRQAQKMESVGRLAGGVAHDFNNILQVMMGYSGMLLDALPTTEETHEFAQEIAQGVNRASALTRQLLAFARKQTIMPQVLDLNASVESILKLLRRLIGEDIDLAWLPEAGLWPVYMDASQIDQLLANLCVNARDAIDGVGKVTIETENITLDDAYCEDRAGFVPGDYVLLAVSDDGHGMDDETLGMIFEPFFTTKGLGEGTGLGLSTVYGIVKQNNGFINVYSEPGEGTTFKLYLPRHPGAQVDAAEEQQTAPPKGRGETVLLVEDNPAILNLAKRQLQAIGYLVYAAKTPLEALRLAREMGGAIDLLLTDLIMPEMSGRELAEQIHALYPALKTLYMSGYTADVIAHRGVLEEGVDFIHKPFSQNDLSRKLREVLDRA
jgi:PAS domain S-box-containing protein